MKVCPKRRILKKDTGYLIIFVAYNANYEK